jgi:hypothetical protein
MDETDGPNIIIILCVRLDASGLKFSDRPKFIHFGCRIDGGDLGICRSLAFLESQTVDSRQRRPRLADAEPMNAPGLHRQHGPRSRSARHPRTARAPLGRSPLA